MLIRRVNGQIGFSKYLNVDSGDSLIDRTILAVGRTWYHKPNEIAEKKTTNEGMSG